MKDYEKNNQAEVISIKENIIEKSDKNTLFDGLKKKILQSKIFNVKGVKILLPLLIILIMGVMLFSFDGTSSAKSTIVTNENIGYTSSLEYIGTIEKKLSDVLSAISGAGKTQIMISIDSSPILNVATNNEEKTVTTSSGYTTTTTNEPIIITANGKSEPMVLGETLPEIKGVIVVSSGAKDVRVKLDIINAVRTVLGISSEKIDVFIGE